MPLPPSQHVATQAVARCHLVTDTRPGRDVLAITAAALDAGVRWVQVRAKHHTDRELMLLTEAVLDLARPSGATVVVDDRADVAHAAGAHGVHLGATDLPVERVRRMLGAEAVIGATARDSAEAAAAAAAGATYVGVGPVFATSSKTGLPAPVGIDTVAAVAADTDLPVIAISGIDAGRAQALRRAGVHGVAVLSAVSEAADPAMAAADLLDAVEV
ncbi:MAG TPA: thiamine phosphate synthase [Nocardioidaceae bacterium]|nr:thiamine phosphate synthase [Nocardioidaceae bacterium]